MVLHLYSATLNGMNGLCIDVEVDLSAGLPNLVIVGMGDTAIRESRERIRSSMKSFGYKFPSKRMVINLAPASLKKEGALYDLAMTLGLLHASDQISLQNYQDYGILGELSLDGLLRPVKGVLSMVIAMKKKGLKKAIVPYLNRKEAAVVKGIDIFPVKTLADAILLMTNKSQLHPYIFSEKDESHEVKKLYPDFKDVKGQPFVKRALEIAASGGHNLLMVGAPGTGKSMLAKRFSGILPKMNFEESLECTQIQSIMGILKKDKLVRDRPFRSPHHSISYVGLVGGGKDPRPGEISMAHNGVLFLDELPEFNRSVLEVLRQPLEDDQVTIARASGSITFPSQIILIAAMNPCPCGFLTDEKKACHCTSSQIQKYRAKISGPLLDRIDLHVQVPSVSFEAISQKSEEESSSDIRARVESVRKIQEEKLSSSSSRVNAHMADAEIEKYCSCEKDVLKVLKKVIEDLGFSARAYTKLLKVSRTIADMEKKEKISVEHVLEAVQYRGLDRPIFS
ncbi:hypothetical protein AB834_00335 [PVC group bacterium (ex Bugula neritina AB1)]|nr:hypothetical protein AB834_00335 [PVC group bacterium (ex Bugula neritina AB1)]